VHASHLAVKTDTTKQNRFECEYKIRQTSKR
jgi:hypothetical protein